jgi:hypothetical protein
MAAFDEISEVLSKYFDGLYSGDVSVLRSIFHPEGVLFSVVKNVPSFKRLDEWLDAVANRRSPEASGEQRRFQALAIDVAGETAMARVRCPMLGFDYIDYLSLLLVDGRWLIATKTFTHTGT